MEVRLELEIARPPEAVFDYLTDGERLLEWVGGLAEHRLLDRHPSGVGTRFEQTLVTGEGRLEFAGEVTEWRAPTAFAYRLENPRVALDVRFDLVPSPRGTLLSHLATAELRSWLLRAVKMRLTRSAEERLTADLERLRRLLEG